MDNRWLFLCTDLARSWARRSRVLVASIAVAVVAAVAARSGGMEWDLEWAFQNTASRVTRRHPSYNCSRTMRLSCSVHAQELLILLVSRTSRFGHLREG